MKIGDKIRIKSLEELLNQGILHKVNDYMYRNDDTGFMLLTNFKFFDSVTNIKHIDQEDATIPYFLENGIWMPEIMIESLEEQVPPPLVEPNDEIIAEVPVDKNPKVWINHFTGKPFGKLMVKLIELDNKVAEFSSTRFSRLRRHELEYIANILIENGAEDISIDLMTAKELSTWCYENTLTLNA